MEIVCRSLSKSFGADQVLADVSFEVADGEFCVVVGPSGGGKTTLLNCLAGLERPDAGSIAFDGQPVDDVPVEERGLGFVFQDFEDRLFPHKTVEENVAFGLRQVGLAASEADDRIDEVLDLLAIPETRDAYPPNLSGGQQQRVELARQFVRDCEGLLLDDPLSDLDYKLQKRMELELRRRHGEHRQTTVYVTHNQDQALALADKLVVLNRGRVEQVGSPRTVYEEPATAMVGRFVGDSNLLVGEPVGGVDGVVTVETPLGTFTATAEAASAEADTGAILVRPPDVTIGRGDGLDNGITGVVEERIYMGDATEFVVSVPDAREAFQVRLPGQVPLSAIDAELGDEVRLGWDAADANYFDEGRYSVHDDVGLADLEAL